MNRILENMTPIVVALLVLAYFVPMAEAALPPPNIIDHGSHTRMPAPGVYNGGAGIGKYCKLISYEDADGIARIAIDNAPGSNVDNMYPDTPPTGFGIVGNTITYTFGGPPFPPKVFIDVCYIFDTKPITVKTQARDGTGFDTAVITFNNPAKPKGLLKYGATIKRGYNVTFYAINGNFGDIYPGGMAQINNSFAVNNIGDTNASIEMRMENNVSTVYGLVSNGTSIIPAEYVGIALNTTLTNSTYWTYLNSTGTETMVGSIPSMTNQSYDTKLVVPAYIESGTYLGDATIIFGPG